MILSQPGETSYTLVAPGYVDAGGKSLEGAEAWYLNNSQLPNIAGATNLCIQQQTLSSLPVPYEVGLDASMSTTTGLGPLWYTAEAAPWPLTTPANVSGMDNYWFQGTDAVSTHLLYLQLVLSGDSLKYVQWWLATSPPSGGIQPGTPAGVKYTALGLNTLPPTGTNYYEGASLVPSPE